MCPDGHVVTRQHTHTQLNVTFGKLDQLLFGLAQWWWHEVTPFMAFSPKLGRKWISVQEVLEKLVPDKWRNGIPPSTNLSWNIIWHKYKAPKERPSLVSPS